MLVLLFTVSLSLFIFLLLYGFIKTKIAPQQELSKRLNSLNEGTVMINDLPMAPIVEKPVSFKERVLIPAKKSLDSYIANLAPPAWAEMLERKLVLAGMQRTWSVGGYVGFWLTLIFVSEMVAFIYISKQTAITLHQDIIIILLAFIFGAFTPVLLLNMRIKERQKAILHQLPEILDLLCVSVHAGLTFDAALYRITARLKGPLVDECIRALDDVRMGIPRRQALKSMSGRCDVPELTLFTTAVIQAERLGTSIAATLTSQADNMRDRRRQSVKAEALKAPVKMLFPLVLFIFPAIFIVLLLPTVLNLMKSFK